MKKKQKEDITTDGVVLRKPKEFICPLLARVMRYPTIYCMNGVTYEWESLREVPHVIDDLLWFFFYFLFFV